MKSSAPERPDPVETAQAQSAANRDAAVSQAAINMVNQQTPYGSLEYTQRGVSPGGTPQYTATQTLSPQQQRILDVTQDVGLKFGETARDQLGQVSSALAQPINFDSLGERPVFDDAYRESVAENIYSRLEPGLLDDEDALRTRLANQGIMPGSEAFNREMDAINRRRNDLRLAIDAQSGTEAGRQFGLESSSRQQGLSELQQQRSIPLNELAAMVSGAQVQQPGFINPPQQGIAAPDILGATYAGYQADADQYAREMQGLYGLGGTALQGGGYLVGKLDPFSWTGKKKT